VLSERVDLDGDHHKPIRVHHLVHDAPGVEIVQDAARMTRVNGRDKLCNAVWFGVEGERIDSLPEEGRPLRRNLPYLALRLES